MRFFNGLVGLVAGTGLCVTGSEILVGCNSEFHGCAETRTCKPATGGSGGSAGAEDQLEAGSGGTGGNAGKGSGGASSGAGGAKAGAAGKGSGGGNAGEGPAEGGSPSEPESPMGDAGSDTAALGGMAGDATGGTGGTGTPADEAPRVISTTPGNGAKGVASDVEITVTFSEPMDNETTEAAFHSNELPPVQLSWRKNNTVLVIQPTAPLVYADVTDPAADAKFYSFSIAGTASDAGRKPMGDERTFVFTTLRHVTHTLAIPAGYGRNIDTTRQGAVTNTVACNGQQSVELRAGDSGANSSFEFMIAFDLSSVPTGVTEWHSAHLHLGDLRHSGSHVPFGSDRLGPLYSYSTRVGLTVASFDFETGNAYRFATQAAQTEWDVDVVESLQQDYAARADLNNQTKYLFRFKTVTDLDNQESAAVADCDSFGLTLDYLAP
jgi:hypothetical protein